MSLYSELADTATEMLTEFGQPCIVTNFESGVEDPNTGVVTQTSSVFTTVGVLLDYDYRNFGDSSESYLQVTKSDKRILVSAVKVINTGDLLFIDNTGYKAYVVKVVNPAGTRVLYDIWAQR
jgi:hypothetical protein